MDCYFVKQQQNGPVKSRGSLKEEHTIIILQRKFDSLSGIFTEYNSAEGVVQKT